MSSRIPINSPVLQSIQPCLLDLVDSNDSEILYANEYSGLAQVAMSDDLRGILDSDFGEVGPNLLIQLQKKMRAVPGGPWYIDSRDGCIYIHNRNFRDIPVYTYSYQANSGELLDISFKTNYVTKRTSGGIISGVDHNKNINTEVTFSNLDMTTLQGDDWTKARQVAHDKAINERNRRISSGEYFSDTRYGQDYVSMDEALDLYKQGGMDRVNEAVNQARVNAYLNAMTVPELQEEATSILEQSAVQRGVSVSQIRDELKSAMEGGNLEGYLKTIFGKSIHTFNKTDPYHPQGGYPMTFQVYDIDLFDYGLEIDLGSLNQTQRMAFNAGFNTGITNDFSSTRYTWEGASSEIVNNQAKEAGLIRSNLARESLFNKYHNRVHILEDHGLVIKDDSKPISGGGYTSTYTYTHKLKIMVESNNNIFKAPTWRLLLALYTRQLGDGKTAKDVEAHVQSLIHANDEIIEKVITCHMTCMGNPFLESSQVLTLGNLGKTWSGRWYIKTCRHNISAQSGYTCQLTLVQNYVKASSTGLSTQVKTDKPWDGEPLYNFMFNVTPEEARYYVMETTSEDDKVEFLLRLLSSRKVDSSDNWNEFGIVRVISNTSTTSTGEVDTQYFIDPEAPNISKEVRDLYELPARAAVINNNLTDVMDKITKENDK